MTNKFTPGPWEEFKGIVSATNGSVVCIADCRNAESGGNWSGSDLATCSYRDANARLIAAAPDLLEAAKAALNCFCEIPVTQARAELLRLLGDAIEKAIGDEDE